MKGWDHATGVTRRCEGHEELLGYKDAPASTGCSGKIVFFHNSQQPLPRLQRDLQSSQRYASVQSLPLADNFLYNQ